MPKLSKFVKVKRPPARPKGPPPFRDLLEQHRSAAGLTVADLADRVGVVASMLSKVGAMRAPRDDVSNPHPSPILPPPDLVEKLVKAMALRPAQAAEFRMAALLLRCPDALDTVRSWDRYRRA